jgi:hypothetical protein
MLYYRLEPEVAGGLGERTRLDTSTHPPRVHHLHYEFEGWLGDALLATFPCFIVTARLGHNLLAASLSGFHLAPLEVSRSALFDELYPKRVLPAFEWLQVTGLAGQDDCGLTTDATLVVSQAAKAVIEAHGLSHCVIEAI